jgi:hypothetical protein
VTQKIQPIKKEISIYHNQKREKEDFFIVTILDAPDNKSFNYFNSHI